VDLIRIRFLLRYSIVGILIFFCLDFAQAQDHDYIQYTTKDGLPTNYVYGVVEDDEGYIWAYTENGMAKFDGYGFQHFSTKDGLSGNDVVYALKDDKGKIWLQIYNGKPAYIFGDSVTTITDENCTGMRLIEGKIYYGCYGGTLIYNSNDLEIHTGEYQLDTLLLQKEPQVFQLDSIVAKTQKIKTKDLRGMVLIHETRDSVYYYSLKQEIIFSVIPDGYVAAFPMSGKIYCKKNGQKKVLKLKRLTTFDRAPSASLIEQLDAEGKFLMSYNDKTLLLLDMNKEEVVDLNAKYSSSHFSPNPGNISVLKNSFLVNSRKGTYELDFDGNLIDSINFNTLSENYNLLRFYKDSKGNFWVGSREGGLFLIPKNKRKTQRLIASFSKDKAFEGLFKTNNGSLLGITDNTGVYKINGAQVSQILTPDKRTRFRSGVNTPDGFVLSSSLKSLVVNEGGSGFEFQRFSNRFSIQNNAQYQELKKLNQIRLVDNLHNRISMIYHKKENSIYSSAHSSVITQHNILQNEVSSKVNFQLISVFCYDSFRDRVYAANSEGIFLYENGQLIPFLHLTTALKNIASLYVNKQSLWIGTENDGLYVYSFATEKLTKKSDAQYVRNIKTTPSGDMLVASNEGVFIFNKKPDDRNPIAHYTINEGKNH